MESHGYLTKVRNCEIAALHKTGTRFKFKIFFDRDMLQMDHVTRLTVHSVNTNSMLLNSKIPSSFLYPNFSGCANFSVKCAPPRSSEKNQHHMTCNINRMKSHLQFTDLS